MSRYKYDIAISYASEQKTKVERTVNRLKENKINVYFAPDNEQDLIGQNILNAFHEIYANECKYIIAFISKDYVKKDITKNELAIAISRYNNGDHCLIPVYLDETRIKSISEDLYYFNAVDMSEYEIANSITNFISDRSNKEDNNLSTASIPNDAIIFLSGATGVGKTTLARRILVNYPSIIIMEEVDLIRETLRNNTESNTRKILEYIISQRQDSGSIDINDLLDLLNFNLLSKSTTELSYKQMVMQANCIKDALEKVCCRLREKKIPSILEGVNLPFESLFTPMNPNLNYFIYSTNMLFINLYLDNEEEHRRHLLTRAQERSTDDTSLKHIMSNFSKIRTHNKKLHSQAQYYSSKLDVPSTDKKRIHSIDISGDIKLSIEENIKISVDRIIKIINGYFT